MEEVAVDDAEAVFQVGLSAYILAGGRSSRMGTDKALIEIAGKPLIAHATAKLRRLCPRIHILSANPALASYAPLVPDIHPDTGPIGGIEAALTHTSTEWNLILPVDVPFLPAVLLAWWIRTVIQLRTMRVRVALFRVDGVLQPTLLLIHRDAAPILAQAISRGEYKLVPALEGVARQLAPVNSLITETIPYILSIEEHFAISSRQPPVPQETNAWHTLTEAQRAAQSIWFANLNTPHDLAEAQLHLDALDT
ncbi:MAG: hypothetical protein NVS9B15_00950 [Acidobacteriaceae bacterium]